MCSLQVPEHVNSVDRAWTEKEATITVVKYSKKYEMLRFCTVNQYMKKMQSCIHLIGRKPYLLTDRYLVAFKYLY